MNELAQATQKVDLQPKAASAAIPPQPTAGGPAARGALQRMGDRALLQSGRLENLDRMTNAALSRLTMGVSPVSLVMSWFDWAAHLAASPGKQFQLGQKMLDNILAWNIYALDQALDADTTPPVVPSRGDQRFADEAWQRYPFNLISQGFLLTEDWWRQATTGVRGVSRHDEAAVSFAARQVLDTAAPSNVPVLNPEVLETTMKEGERMCCAAPPMSSRTRVASPTVRSRPAPRPSRWARMSPPRPARSSSATG